MNLPAPVHRVEFKDSDGQHFYSVDGKDMMLPGVTTILSRTLSKPALVPWASKKVADDFAARLKALGAFPTEGQLEFMVNEAKKAPNRERDAAGDKGTNVHDLIEQFVTTGKVTIEDDAPNTVRESFEAFLKWFEGRKWKVLAGDTPVVSLQMGYGGRLDAVMVDELDRLILCDWKTSRGVYQDHFAQLGGYSVALKETYAIAPHFAGILHVRPKECVWHPAPVATVEWAWRSVKQTYDAMETIKKLMEENGENQR